MELQPGRSRAGSVVAGGYDEFFTAVDDCMSLGHMEPTPAPRSGRSPSVVSNAAERRRSRSDSREKHRSSLQRKTSQHGADLRRQNGLGSALNVAVGQRVKSTVSGFLNKDYHTPNDSVPVIPVAENYSRVLVHTSDEDTDSEIEEPTEKKYGTQAKTLRDALKTNFSVRKSATGIPRMEGHMRLPDRRSAPKEPKDPKLYMGNSYLVEAPDRLERSTRALTRTAIVKVMEMERARRVTDIRARGATVSQTWLGVQNELKQKAKLAEEEENEVNIASTQTAETNMEFVREQMMREVHRRVLCAEEEEVKEFKQMFFKGVAKNKLRPDTMEVVTGTSEHLGSVLEELVEAFQCSEMDEEIREEAVVERSQDVKDACLNELMRCVVTHKINIEIQIETEHQVREFKRGKPPAARKGASSENQPDMATAKNQVGGTIEKIFNRVESRELKKEDRIVDRVAEFKCICQEDLIRKVWRRKVSVLSSHEKARRIMEADDPASMDDDKRLAVSDAWVRVQAQMIIDKFKGSRPMKRSSMTEVAHSRDGSRSPARTGMDRKLRAARERFRKPAVYFCDEDDEHARERARRKCRLNASPSDRVSGGGDSRGSLTSGRSRTSRRRSSRSGSSHGGSQRSSLSGGSPVTAVRNQSRGLIKVAQSPERSASPSRSEKSTAARIPLVKSSLNTAGLPLDRSPNGQEQSQSSAAHSPSRQSAQPSRSPSRQSAAQPYRSPSRQSAQTARSRSRQSVATARSPSRQSVATARSPSRQSTATARNALRPSSTDPSPRKQSAAKSIPSPSRRSSQSRSPPGKQPSAASRGASTKSATAPPVAANRSRSFVSTRSSSPAARARDVSPPGILKRSGKESPRRHSAAPFVNQQQRRRSASSQQAAQQQQALKSRRSVSARGPGSTVSAPADPVGRRSRSGSGRGEFMDVVAPRRLLSDVAQPTLAEPRQYRRRGEKTDEFQRERAAIADQRQHERNEKLQRKRGGHSPQTTDQFRSHWTAHIE